MIRRSRPDDVLPVVVGKRDSLERRKDVKAISPSQMVSFSPGTPRQKREA
jgi:hypothetical protein